MTTDHPVGPQEPSAKPTAAPKPRWRKWLVLGLALTCCCGGPVVWVPSALAIGGNQIARLHQALKPGMSTGEVLARVDEVGLWSLGLSHVFAFPEAPARTARRHEESGETCPVDQSLVWSHNYGSPWGRGKSPTLDAAAKGLAACDKIKFRFVVLFSRFNFTVRLQDGRIAEVGPIEGEL